MEEGKARLVSARLGSNNAVVFGANKAALCVARGRDS